MEHAANVLRTERSLPWTPEQIYAVFADAGTLAKWWGPKGFRNTFETFEFRQGGKWTFVMHAPDGTDYPNEIVITELQPGRKIVLQHTTHFTLTVSLTPDGQGTRVDWVQAFEDAKTVEQIRHIVEPANEENLDRLEAVLRGEL